MSLKYSGGSSDWSVRIVLSVLPGFFNDRIYFMLHIIPVNDIKPHEETSTCHCGPSLEMESGEMIIVHNSFYVESKTFIVGEAALRRNQNFPDEPVEWIPFVVNETYLELIVENPDDYQKISEND